MNSALEQGSEIMHIRKLVRFLLLVIGLIVLIASTRMNWKNEELIVHGPNEIIYGEVGKQWMGRLRIQNRGHETVRLIGANNVCTDRYCVGSNDATGTIPPGESRTVEFFFVPVVSQELHGVLSLFFTRERGKGESLRVEFVARPATTKHTDVYSGHK